jgi:hypothetical protein
MYVAIATDVSEVHDASIFRVEVGGWIYIYTVSHEEISVLWKIIHQSRESWEYHIDAEVCCGTESTCVLHR